MAKIINCTPAPVRVFLDDECVKAHTYMPSGKHISINSDPYEVGNIDGVYITRKDRGYPFMEDASDNAGALYAELPGVYYIVPEVIAYAFPWRKDFLYPAEPVYDDDHVIGYRSLGTVA